MRKSLLSVLLFHGMVSAVGQMTPSTSTQPTASFEVATIKPSSVTSQRQGIDSTGRTVTLFGQTLTAMIAFAFQVQKDQIVGGPKWIGADKYDIEGLSDLQGEPDLDQMREMVKQLLAERFSLSLHRGTRKQNYYAIIVSKPGAKLARTNTPSDRMPHQSISGNSKQSQGRFHNCQMTDFALGLQLLLDHPVVDETGLKGRYDFDLKWQSSDPQSASADGPPILFSAIEEQLGLRLIQKKGPILVLAVDKAARPSAN